MGTVTQLPVIAGVEITTDEQGRFNLNALHRASRTEQSKKPSEWLRSKQASELIRALESQSGNPRFGVVATIRGGNSPGTFAHELLAVSYAGWISPTFQLTVNQTFIDYRAGKLQRPAVPQTLAQALRLAADQAEELEQARPKVAALNRIATASQGSVCITDAAKALGVKRYQLTDYMLTHKWCYRRAGRRGHLVAYQRAIEAACLEHKVANIDTDDGNRTVHQVLVTPKGLATLARRLAEAGVITVAA